MREAYCAVNSLRSGPLERNMYATARVRHSAQEVRGPVLIFQGFRRLVEAIQALASALDSLARIQRELGPALDRLEGLERSRIHFEAECEGMLLKADGKLKAAASAEQRERQLKKANDRLADPFREDGEEGTEPAPIQPDYVTAGEAPRVPPLHLDVATNNKAHAVRAKFGL